MVRVKAEVIAYTELYRPTRSQGLKNSFLCPDGRVATGEGRLAQ